jgi:hypothetical protein
MQAMLSVPPCVAVETLQNVGAHLSPYICLNPACIACADALWPPPVLLINTRTLFCRLGFFLLRGGLLPNGQMPATAVVPGPSYTTTP